MRGGAQLQALPLPPTLLLPALLLMFKGRLQHLGDVKSDEDEKVLELQPV